MIDPSQSKIERYRDAAIALLPPGRAFCDEPEGDVSRLLEAISVEYARVDDLAESLLRNQDPAKADDLLRDWETALGLPSAGTLDERRGACVARLVGRRRHDRDAFSELAERLGYGQGSWVPVDGGVNYEIYNTTPESMLSGRWRFNFACTYASSQISYGWLFQLGFARNEAILLKRYGATMFLILRTEKREILRSPISFVPRQEVTITVEPAAGSVTVSGASSGNGVLSAPDGPWRWAGDRLAIGMTAARDSAFVGSVNRIESYSPASLKVDHVSPAQVGSGAGSPCYADEWSAYTRVTVQSAEQTADDALRASFEFLRRSHTYLDVVLEGPQGSERKVRQIAAGESLQVTGYKGAPFLIGQNGELTIQLYSITQYSDFRAGFWELWCSCDGSTFRLERSGQTGADLAQLTIQGYAGVHEYDRIAHLSGVAGKFGILRFVSINGVGQGYATVDLRVSTW